MNLLKYINKNGIAHVCKVIYRYKIDLVIQKIMGIFLKNKPLKDIIIIESHNDFDCNGGAFYDYLIDNGYNKKYIIVWMIKNIHMVPSQLPFNVVVVPLFKPSIKKDYYMWRAKYFTADCEMREKKRADQKYFYLTHGGCTLKNVKGILEVPQFVDYVLSSSDNYAPYMCDNFSMEYPNKKILNIGFPCNDILYANCCSELIKITSQKYSKMVLWMPTFRTGKNGRRDSNMDFSLGIPLIESIQQLEAVNDFLKEHNVLLIIKIHPMQELTTVAELKNRSNIIVLDGNIVKQKGIDTYKLMANADGLLSDYSSAAYSYLLLNRPIGFVLADVDEYKPGFSVKDLNKFLCGHKICTYEDLYQFINDIVNSNDIYGRIRKDLLDWMYEYQDGNTSKRLVEFMKL